MNADVIAVFLGTAAAIIMICFLVWRGHIRKKAAGQLEKEFLKEEDEHEL